MPTAGKLAGALLFAALAYVLASIAWQASTLTSVPGSFYVICALIGMACGWRVMGGRAEAPAMDAPSSGVLTVVISVVVAVLFFATREMLQRSMNHRYKEPTDAIIGVFEIAADYLWMLVTPTFLLTMLSGGVVCGIVAGFVGRRWS